MIYSHYKAWAAYYGRPNVSKFAKLKFVVANYEVVIAKIK